MQCTRHRHLSFAFADASAATTTVQECIRATRRGCVTAALSRLNALKAASALVEGVDYARALCFLADGPQRNPFAARQSLLEELRLHPQHLAAQQLLDEVNEAVRPLLLPPAEVAVQHPLFALLCDALLGSTMLTWPRLLHLYEATQRLAKSTDTKATKGDRGHIVECGTAGGGSAVMMAVVLAETEATADNRDAKPCEKRRVFALDTFTGMPPPSSKDRLVKSASSAVCGQDHEEGNVAADTTASWGTGTCRSSVEHVRQLARNFAVEDRLVLLPGRFEDSIPGQLLCRDEIRKDSIALLHVDADWYASTRAALQLLVPVMRRRRFYHSDSASDVGVAATAAPTRYPPRIVQVDDYHYWEGCRQAVDEYLTRWPPEPSAKAVSPPLPPRVADVDDNAIWFAVL